MSLHFFFCFLCEYVSNLCGFSVLVGLTMLFYGQKWAMFSVLLSHSILFYFIFVHAVPNQVTPITSVTIAAIGPLVLITQPQRWKRRDLIE